MRLDSTLSNSYGLPLAYQEFQKLGDLHGVLTQLMIDESQRWFAQSGTVHPWSTHQGRSEAVQFQDLTMRAHRVFSEIFQEEMRAGNFEIFEAQEFGSFILSQEQSTFIRAWLLKDDGVLEGFLEAFKSRITLSLPIFVGLFGFDLNSSQLVLLWEAFKAALDVFNPEVTCLEMIELRDSSSLVKNKETRLLLSMGLSAFFEAVNSPSEVLDQACILSGLTLFNIVSKKRVTPVTGVTFTDTVSFEAPPLAFKMLHPELFESQLSKWGIDGAVAELLLPSWVDSFTSFLQASKSLSAEDASLLG